MSTDVFESHPAINLKLAVPRLVGENKEHSVTKHNKNYALLAHYNIAVINTILANRGLCVLGW